ncbi:hypothetical protein AAHA92_18204 [Salvia divinorum]|uniref:Uncharacterized protein n=1 Tax=Salvia divinorum TaxID=28513 RepID=A0ABD1H1B7_SALDI
MEHKKKSAGLCERIHNAVSPFRPRIPRISDQPRAPISVIADKSSVQNTSPQSKIIPVEFRHSAAHFSPQNSNNGGGEIAIIRGHKFAKSVSGKEKHAPPPPPPHHVHFGKTKDEDHHHEGKFTDYITKFKNRMVKTASHIGGDGGGGGGGGGNSKSTRRDSFNDKVSNYIDQAKIKIRTTTDVGIDHNDN